MQRTIRYLATGIVMIMICNSAQAQQALQQTLWEEGEGNYESYRIPSIIVTTNGTLLAFAEGRKEPGDTGDIDLLLRRSFDNGKTWTDPQVVWDDGGNTCGNPNPVVDHETGRIFLFSTWNLGRDTEKEIITKTSDDTRRPYVLYSDDDGETWSEPRELTDCCKESSWGWYATGPGIGIQLEHGKYEGRLVIPANHSYDERDSTVYRRFEDYGYGAHVLISDDHGETWQKSEPIRPGTNESQLAELNDGTLMMNMRSYNGEYSRAVATSADGGETWSEIEHDHQLVESQVQASIFNYGDYKDKMLMLFSNPAVPVGRTHMTLRASFDEGQHWAFAKLIHGGPSAYSSLARLPNGNIGLFFEAGTDSPYETMRFVSFPPDMLFSEKKIGNQ
ncbi:MAG TPA: sialidase family protein [Fodinibius sp.]|nr:sialidase family protein [Fodinibius sp.]